MIKIIFISLLLSLISCASVVQNRDTYELSSLDVAYIITENMKPAHQCDKNLPIFYMIGENVPADIYEIINKSFEYWNSFSNKKLFMQIEYIQEVYDSGGGITPVGLGELKSNVGGKVAVKYNEIDGCIFKTKLVLNFDIQYLPTSMQNNIIRHEIGHLLGFDDSNDENGIMHRSVSSRDGIKNLSLKEINAFKLFY